MERCAGLMMGIVVARNGRRSWKQLPTPGVLVTLSSPCIALARLALMVSPSPVPPRLPLI
ncbi:hypothetical protein [Citrobacter freundii]|uniref:Uncharacterized protein n=1 Tax=Citrobacter freundii TaxID=546 RepID=A0A7G2ILN6_CITFR|nr:hypothetical protein [Citrobacter freundii]